MNKFFDFFSFSDKDEKIDDKAMLTYTVVTAVVIVLCLATMSLTAYAYFSYNVASNSNMIKSASFEVSVTVSTNNNEISETDNKYILEKSIYDVTITGKGTAEKGFCILYLKLSDGTVRICHTPLIYTDQSSGGNVIGFSLDLSDIPEESVSLEFDANWGAPEFFVGVAIGRIVNSGETVKYSEITVPSEPNEPVFLPEQNEPEKEPEPQPPQNEPELPEEPVIPSPNEPEDPEEPTDPPVSDKPDEPDVPQEIEYTVVAGDNLTKIANRFGTTVKAIQERNNIDDPNIIYIDQILIIPSAAAQ